MRVFLVSVALTILLTGCAQSATIVPSNGRTLPLNGSPSWQWHAANAGNPTIAEFRGTADPSSLRILNELAGPLIHQILVLADGRVAFATNSGLSLWDGTRISSYTGPSFDPALGTMIAGNSGLPGNTITGFSEDRFGRLWIATNLGICRIDKESWETATPPAPFGATPIQSVGDVMTLFSARDGRIVLGSRGSGITIADPKENTVITIYHDTDPNHMISAITEDTSGQLWFAVRGLGVLCYDGRSLRIYDHSNSPEWILDDDLRSICVGPDNSLWVGSVSGLSRLRPDGVIEHFTAADALPSSIVWHLAVDLSGAVWVITDQGAAVFREGWRYPILPSGFLIAGGYMSQDKAGRYWIGGVGALHLASPQMLQENPRLTRISTFKRSIALRYPALPEIPAGEQSRAARDSSGQIIGYDSGHLLAYDGKNWQDLTPLLKGSEVWSLQGDKLGRVWVGTGGAGLIGIQGKSIRRYNNDPTHAKSCIYATAETSNGDLYVGTQYGLWRLRGETWEDLILNEEQRMQAIQVVVDPQDRVWVLDPNYGIFVYQRNAFTLLSSSALLKGKGVQTLRRTPEGNMEADTINRSRIPAVKATYRWLPDTPLLQPELINK